MHKKNKGFTLPELLIVVAIVAVLVAIAAVVMPKQVEKSRESKDLSDVRNAYAEVMYAVMTGDDDAEHNGEKIKTSYGYYTAVVSPLKQKITGWETDTSGLSIGNSPCSEWVGLPAKDGSCTIKYYPETDTLYLIWKNGIVRTSSNGVGFTTVEFPALTDGQKENAITISYDDTMGYTSGNGGHAIYAPRGARYEDYIFAVPNQVYIRGGTYYISDGQHWYAWSEYTKEWYYDF